MRKRPKALIPSFYFIFFLMGIIASSRMKSGERYFVDTTVVPVSEDVVSAFDCNAFNRSAFFGKGVDFSPDKYVLPDRIVFCPDNSNVVVVSMGETRVAMTAQREMNLLAVVKELEVLYEN